MIKKIMQLLEQGKMIRVNKCDMIVRNGLLYWWCFGQSANDFTERGVNFVLNTIAKYDGVAYVNESRSHYDPKPILTRI